VAYPGLDVSLNGGIANRGAGGNPLAHVDGVMIGRAAYQEPWRLLAVDPLIFGAPAPSRPPRMRSRRFCRTWSRACARHALHSMTRHILGLFHGVPGARAFRRHIGDRGGPARRRHSVLRDAVSLVMTHA